MLQGSVDLLNEVATSKIAGEEEIYSHTDLYMILKRTLKAHKKFMTYLNLF